MKSRSVMVIVLVLGFTALPLDAQAPGDSASWMLWLDAGVGPPSGWVQVRENALEGTRLHFRRDLGVRRVWTVRGTLVHPIGTRTLLDIALEGWSLRGDVVPRSDVVFNGATLAADSVLHTRTGFGDFLQLTANVRRRLVVRRRDVLSGSVGLTFVALNFVLQGTLAPGSALHETREDFVTQELPVPVLGLTWDHALTPRLTLAAHASGGWLPIVNSLRREGGEVTITQTHADLGLALRWRMARHSRLSLGWRFTHFAQREESGEDGNAIRLDRGAVTVGASVF